MSLGALFALAGVGGASGCGSTCTAVGGKEGYFLEISGNSTWGDGIHSLSVSYSVEETNYIGEWIDCQIYPYFDGTNLSCTSSERVTVSHRGIYIYGWPNYVNIRVEDSAGFRFQKDFHPKYDETFPNGEKCGAVRYGTNTIVLDGAGEKAGYVQALYEKREARPGGGGAGGASFFEGEGVIGADCESNADCTLPLFCSRDFLGDFSVCTASCHHAEDCPSSTECAFEIIGADLTLIDGYCLRPCDESRDCSELGSACGVQDIGHFCF